MSKIAAAALAAILLLAGGPVAAFAQTAPAASVKITNAWARATPAGAQNGAAYATLQSAAPDRLTGVSSPIAAKAELHEMSMNGTVMQMREVGGVDLPAGKPVTLKPGGFHIMLLGLKQPLHPGDKVPLTFTFAKTAPQQTEATVGSIGAMGPGGTTAGGGAGGSKPMSMPMHQ